MYYINGLLKSFYVNELDNRNERKKVIFTSYILTSTFSFIRVSKQLIQNEDFQCFYNYGDMQFGYMGGRVFIIIFEGE